MDSLRVAVVGSGAWGVALACLLVECGGTVRVWSSSDQRATMLSSQRRHSQLQNVRIPDSIAFTHDMHACLQDAQLVIVAVSSQYIRDTAAQLAQFVQPSQTVACVTKGIEAGSFMSMSQVVEDEFARNGAQCQGRVVALIGPTHAEEVALGMPSAILAACPDEDAARRVQHAVSNHVLRVYTSTDRDGAELCGAAKNVIAIASGVLAGMGYGDNTRAALITRGMAEVCRLGTAMGASTETFFGLAGVGDMIVTATSLHSRNFRAGRLMGQGMPPAQAALSVDGVVEGLLALPTLVALAREHDVDMPITFAIDAVVNGSTPIADVIDLLMDRALKPETI